MNLNKMSNQKTKEGKREELLKLFLLIRNNIVFREFKIKPSENEQVINQKYSRFLGEVEREFYAKRIIFSFNCDLY